MCWSSCLILFLYSVSSHCHCLHHCLYYPWNCFVLAHIAHSAVLVVDPSMNGPHHCFFHFFAKTSDVMCTIVLIFFWARFSPAEQYVNKKQDFTCSQWMAPLERACLSLLERGRLWLRSGVRKPRASKSSHVHMLSLTQQENIYSLWQFLLFARVCMSLQNGSGDCACRLH